MLPRFLHRQVLIPTGRHLHFCVVRLGWPRKPRVRALYFAKHGTKLGESPTEFHAILPTVFGDEILTNTLNAIILLGVIYSGDVLGVILLGVIYSRDVLQVSLCSLVEMFFGFLNFVGRYLVFYSGDVLWVIFLGVSS